MRWRKHSHDAPSTSFVKGRRGIGGEIAGQLEYPEVTQYTDEVQAQALADAAAAEELYLSSLESQVQTSMQEYFDDPATALFLPVYVGEASLIRASESTFEGMVTLQMQGYNPHQISVHVTADGRNFMWKTAPGALVALLG